MNEWIEVLKWCATAFLSFSAIQVSFNITWATKWWAYVGFLIGHVVWCAIALNMNEWALVWLNLVFAFIDLYAIYIRINKEIGDKNAKNCTAEINYR